MSETVDGEVSKRYAWGNGTLKDGTPITTIDHAVEAATVALRERPECGELWMVQEPESGKTICITGNGPKSRYHAKLIATMMMSFETILGMAESSATEIGELMDVYVNKNDLIAHDRCVIDDALEKVFTAKQFLRTIRENIQDDTV